MPDARELIQLAFEKLSQKEGFVTRVDQQHLAYLVSDCIEERSTGVFEAPTGLGKSLSALIPAIAQAIAASKRIVVATYTNVLAEQYWMHELPLARSLFEQPVKAEFLIGRQRYACLAAINETHPRLRREFISKSELGIESEFRRIVHRSARELAQIWDDISAPVVCPSRMCPYYADCVYYRARRSAERANIVITNHSVVMQDALLRQVTNGLQSLLGELDFVVIDEAHDFPHAARSALEFELSEPAIGGIIGLINRMEQIVIPTAAEFGAMQQWVETCEIARESLRECQQTLHGFGMRVRRSGILAASPDEILQAEPVRNAMIKNEEDAVRQITDQILRVVHSFLDKSKSVLSGLKSDTADGDAARESIANYLAYINEFALNCSTLLMPKGVAVSHLDKQIRSFAIRTECVHIAEPLQELLWKKLPTVSLSATLAIDREFEWYRRISGVEAKYYEILNAPFDYRSQTALYLPPPGQIPDPSYARNDGIMDSYYDALATELGRIIEAVGGKTLALFHSREEMENVFERMIVSDRFPILMQKRTAIATVGEKFKADVTSSLFALRSFWTGFDAPGETLSCVCLVRIPFEVPTDAASIARSAWIRARGFDPFTVHTLPQSKMLMRQGAGRLIRRDSDRGVIVILDPRTRTKRYGSEILENLPEGMRVFDDLMDAVGHVGIHSSAQ